MTVSSLVSKVIGFGAPLLGTLIGSPLAGIALSLIGSAFGVKSDPDAIMAALSQDPEAAVKLKQIEAQHSEILAQIASTDFYTSYLDRKDARDKAIEGKYDWFVHMLSVFITLGFFCSVVMVFFTKADPGDHDILNMMLGSLGTCWVQVIAFYFGNINKTSG